MRSLLVVIPVAFTAVPAFAHPSIPEELMRT